MEFEMKQIFVELCINENIFVKSSSKDFFGWRIGICFRYVGMLIKFIFN
jgi:hypothetical protein